MSTELTKATEHLPSKPIEEWSIAELLQDGARLGLMRLREFASRVCLDEEASKERRSTADERLIVEASTTLAKLLATVQMEQMRRKSDEAAMSAFMATVDAFEAQLYGPTEKTAERQRAKTAERPA